MPGQGDWFGQYSVTTAWFRSAPSRSALEKFTADMLAPDRFALERSAPVKFAPVKLALAKSHPDRSVEGAGVQSAA